MIDNKLPQPDREALEHSLTLQSLMSQELSDVGSLPFSRFMHLALYAPGLGYYSAGSTKFGAAGDFVTAPETSPLFAECLAEQLIEVFTSVESTVLEFGAGTGQLALDILRTLNHRHCEPDRYWILETSADLASRQKSLLRSELSPELFARVEWLEQLPESFSGVVIANEVLDAMPVECVEIGPAPGECHQCFVAPASVSTTMPAVNNATDVSAGATTTETTSGSTSIGLNWSEHWQPAGDALARIFHGRLGELADHLPVGYRTEINLQLEGWFSGLSRSLQNGLVLIIDYGHPRREFYSPDRTKGTLRCYYRHRMHDDPFIFPGLQDITADVDFTSVVEAATDAGFELHGYTSQGQFLLANGLAQLAESRLQALDPAADQERFLIAQQVNTLSMASAMGERFQVMGLSKGLDAPLRGFGTLDLSYRL